MKKGLLAAFLCVWGYSAWAAHTQARLILDAQSARPGDTVMAGIHLRMDPGWHTYWKNPGLTGGEATSVAWELPAGVTAGSIQWPVPEKLKTGGSKAGDQPAEKSINFVYSKEVVLLVPLKLSKDLRPGNLNLKASVSWIECERLCVPGDAEVQASIEVGAENRASAEKDLITSWQKKLPNRVGM